MNQTYRFTKELFSDIAVKLSELVVWSTQPTTQTHAHKKSGTHTNLSVYKGTIFGQQTRFFEGCSNPAFALPQQEGVAAIASLLLCKSVLSNGFDADHV